MIKTLIAASLFLFSTNLFARDLTAPLSAVNKPIVAEKMQRATNEINESDSLSEQSEAQSLRLQKLADRQRKADEASSNIMKKYSDTAGTIIQNTK